MRLAQLRVGTLKLTNSCFIDNDFLGKGPVIIPDDSVVKENKGNFATFDANVVCQNIAVGDKPDCIEFDSDTCVLGAGTEPTTPPANPTTPAPANPSTTFTAAPAPADTVSAAPANTEICPYIKQLVSAILIELARIGSSDFLSDSVRRRKCLRLPEVLGHGSVLFV